MKVSKGYFLKMKFKLFLYIIFIFLYISFSLVSTQSLVSAQKAYLIFSDSQDNVLYKLDLNSSPNSPNSAQWIVRWNHSVTGVVVSDYYYWDGQNIVLTDSHTPAFDAGLGHIPGRGKQVSDGQNGYFILGINERVPNNTYALRVGSLKVNHRIIHDGQSYSLSEVAERQRIVIKVVTE